MDDRLRKTFRIPEKFSVRKLKKDQLLIILLSGVLLLVIAIPAGDKDDTKASDEGSTYQAGMTEDSSIDNSYVNYLEQHLAESLSQIDGAGDVTVMITLKSSSEKVVEKDLNLNNESVTESDSQGGTRTTNQTAHEESTVYGSNGDSGEEPYVSKEISPQVEGVLVIASGGGNAVVKENITEAVQALFDIDTHKIRIMKKNQTK